MFVYGIKIGINLNSQTQGSPKHMSSAFTKIFRKLKETKIYFRRKFLSIVIKMQKKFVIQLTFQIVPLKALLKKIVLFMSTPQKLFFKKSDKQNYYELKMTFLFIIAQYLNACKLTSE